MKEWLLEQEFLKRVRQVDLDTTLRSERLALVLAPGSHWFWYRGRPFVVFFYRSQDAKGGYQSRRSESLTFQTIGRKQAIMRDLVDEIARCHRKRVGVRSTLNTYNDGWYRVQAYAPRSLDSVILKSGEKERLIAGHREVQAFAEQVSASGSSVSPRVFAVWTSGHWEDFLGIGNRGEV